MTKSSSTLTAACLSITTENEEDGRRARKICCRPHPPNRRANFPRFYFRVRLESRARRRLYTAGGGETAPWNQRPRSPQTLPQTKIGSLISRAPPFVPTTYSSQCRATRDSRSPSRHPKLPRKVRARRSSLRRKYKGKRN